MMATLLLAATLFPAQAAEPMPNVRSIEDRVLAARRAIVRGQVKLDSIVWEFPKGERTVTYQSSKTVWFDGEKIREDTLFPYKGAQVKAGRSSYREVRCFADGRHVFWSDEVLEQDKRVAIHYTDLQPKDANASDAVVDPRLLGFVPMDSPNLILYHLESFIARPDRKEPSLHHEAFNGIDCWRVDYVPLVGEWTSPRMVSAQKRV